ncbi:MAG: DUF1214 domain-containing protein [Bosea sp. (in: a-proteobacteria)]
MRVVELGYVLALAAIVGLGSAWATLGERIPFQKVQAGPWETSPRAYAPDADAYARAIMTQRTHLPLGLGEGLSLTAYADDAGRRLDSSCDYEISGTVPPSRGWTLTLARSNDPISAGPADRIGYSDAELTRNEQGAVKITLSQTPAPGDWLPLPDIGAFRVLLRLYDTPVSGTARELQARDLPQIRRVGCQ